MPPSDRVSVSATAAWYPLKVEPSFRERVWGARDLCLYPGRPAAPERVGEVWLTAENNRVVNGTWAGRTLREICRRDAAGVLGSLHRSQGFRGFPLLVKFIFTEDKLSVQVHPPDEYAQRAEASAGKTEMWHVLQAAPGARLAVGFRQDMAGESAPGRAALREAVERGAIEGMLNWLDVRRGDTFFVPAGTVHAIGAGVVLCEIQQNSDVTYRLYDYNRPGTDGRPRQLHLEKALDVIAWRTRGGRTEPLEYDRPEGGRRCLAACPYFVTERISSARSARYLTGGRFEIWIGLEGEAKFEAADQWINCRMGEAVIVPANCQSFSWQPVSPCVFLRTYEPELKSDVIAPLLARGFSEQQLFRVCFPGPPRPGTRANER